MKLQELLLALVMILLVLPTEGVPANVPGVTDSEVIVGATTPLSGPGAHWGTTALGMKAWADYVNDQGGVHGRKVKIVIKDDAYNPSRGLANLQEMKGQVFALCGVLGTVTCNAAKEFFYDNKVPLVTAYANVRMWPTLPEEKRKYVFIAYTDYTDEGEYLTKYAANKLVSKKIAVFYLNDDLGKSGKAGVEKAVTDLAGKAELVGAVPFAMDERALSTHALKLKESGADTVLIYPTMTHGALILKEMAKIGYRPKVLASFPLGDPIMYNLVGPEVWEGTYIALAGNTGVPGVEEAATRVAEILVKYEPKIKGKEYLGVFGAISMMHFIEGLKNAGRDLSVESFLKGMEKIRDWKPEGIGAPVTYAPDRRHGVNAARVGQAQKGKHVPLEEFTVFKPLF